MRAARAGMTLVEILVAVLILTVISLAMVGILLTSGELFRRGEYGKSASDESITVLAKLEDDLARFVPVADGGFLYAASYDSPPTPAIAGVALQTAGDSILAFVIPAKDPGQRGAFGERARSLVAWWVEQPGAGDDRPVLWRAEMPSGGPSGAAGQRDDQLRVEALMYAAHLPLGDPGRAYVEAAPVTAGVLHFGAWLSLAGDVRPLTAGQLSGDDWSNGVNGAAITYDTSVLPAPLPAEAIRITVCLTGGGRFAHRGVLRQALGSASLSPFVVTGLGSVSTAPGSLLRIGDEWIGYDGYRDGRFRMDSASGVGPVGRGKRRSAVATHVAGDVVWLGQPYAMVRSLPR